MILFDLRNRQPVHQTILFFFFNVSATTLIYPLSLHDALPISSPPGRGAETSRSTAPYTIRPARTSSVDRKSTRLNSSHRCISYAVFCLKKKIFTQPTLEQLQTQLELCYL